MTLWNQTQYALDANVLIAAQRNYYARDICPGFWEFLARHIDARRFLIIDKVRGEILYPPELVSWVDNACGGNFDSTQTQAVARAYSQMQAWVDGNDRFMPAAKAEFAVMADGWLAAYAMASTLSETNKVIVVTNEVLDPNARRRVPLPDLCAEFAIEYMNTYTLLREFGVRLQWSDPS